MGKKEEVMSITDELRERIDDEALLLSTRRELWNIADRIDAEHEKATAGCIHYDPERHYCAVHGDTEHGWVKLPVDADGVPIHVGDKMVFIDLNGNTSEPFIVDGFESLDMWLVRYEDGHRYTASPAHTRHHHELTVEDVLREFFSRYVTTKPKDEDDAIIAEYAAKLRLAGEGE